MKLKNESTTWKIKENKLEKTFELTNFEHLVAFINLITPICERMNHHPNFNVFDYKHITFQLVTHDLNQVSEKDYTLAHQIDEVRRQLK
jgi:4a-hydroxytetrahydrobiopterin dehydratase